MNHGQGDGAGDRPGPPDADDRHSRRPDASDPRRPLEEIRQRAEEEGERGTYSAGGDAPAARGPADDGEFPAREEVDDGTFDPPQALHEIARTLESRGYEAWAVGGAIRDSLLGQGGSDWDLATDARPRDVQRIFPRTVPVGVEHGTVGVLGADEEMYEVTTFRRDVETDGRHAVVEYAGDIEEDLSRRDFTINAVAWRPATNEVRDPFGGRRDMQDRVLRAVGRPRDRFEEDYLRVLRGIRFAGRFGLRMEEETRRALDGAAAHLDGLSAERIREELMKVLGHREASTALRLYADVGVLEEWFPELVDAYTGDPRREMYLAAVDAVAPSRRVLRLVRWILPAADDAEGRVAAGREITDRLKFSNRVRDRAAHLLGHYMPLLSPTDSAAQVREWIAEVGRDQVYDLFRLHLADARAVGAEEKGRYLVHLWRRVREEARKDPPLALGDLAVDGSDLMELGVKQGPEVGILLDELMARVIEEPELNDREELLELAEELKEMGALSEARGKGSGRTPDDPDDAGPVPPDEIIPGDGS